jgi:hypothetical protein
MRQIEECEGYRKLLAAIESDEQKSPGFHDYRAKFEWVIERALHYAERTGLDAADILDRWEEGRNYWYMNYYQDAEQPLLNEKVRVFDTVEDLLASIGKAGFRCPYCGGITKSPYECDSGVIVPKINDGNDGPCNWKVYGLFRDMGKGVHVFVKSELHGELMFMPVAWEIAEKKEAS